MTHDIHVLMSCLSSHSRKSSFNKLLKLRAPKPGHPGILPSLAQVAVFGWTVRNPQAPGMRIPIWHWRSWGLDLGVDLQCNWIEDDGCSFLLPQQIKWVSEPTNQCFFWVEIKTTNIKISEKIVTTLQGNGYISHLQKRKIIDSKVPAGSRIC